MVEDDEWASELMLAMRLTQIQADDPNGSGGPRTGFKRAART